MILCSFSYTWSSSLTAVWTIFMRWCLILVIIPHTSTTFSFSTSSRMMSMAMNVPVRPTPALMQYVHWYLTSLVIRSLTLCYKIIPAVHYHGSMWWAVVLFDATVVGQYWCSILWYIMIRPWGEVVLGNHTRKIRPFSELGQIHVYIMIIMITQFF